MVRFLAITHSWVARPQLVAVLLTVLFIAGSFISLPEIVRPTQAASIPVIQPLKLPVQGISIAAPVDCSRVPCIALTFDDGPDPKITPQVLDTLSRHNAKATFFLVGLQVPGNEHIVRDIHRAGHEIGNHTWSHRDLSKLSPAKIKEDIAKAQQVITAAGVPTPRLFRPPYGAFDAMVRSHVPLTVVAWNVDPEDWRAEDDGDVVRYVVRHAKPGAIIDLHDIYPTTAEALGPILQRLEMKYHFVTVSELLSLPPGQPGIFYGR